jgi:molybdenum cofactor biosynthesis protein B
MLKKSGAGVRPLRCVVATVAAARASVKEDVTQVVVDSVRAAGFVVERMVTVNREKAFIHELVLSIGGSNEADAILLIGGVGIGARDLTCEALDELVDRRMDGFGEAYRRLLVDAGESVANIVTGRAMAGVYNGCVVVALPRQTRTIVRRTMQTLVVPMLPRAVRIAIPPVAPESHAELSSP